MDNGKLVNKLGVPVISPDDAPMVIVVSQVVSSLSVVNLRFIDNKDYPHYYLRLEGEAYIPDGDCHTTINYGKFKGQTLHTVPTSYINHRLKLALIDMCRFRFELERRALLKRLIES